MHKLIAEYCWERMTIHSLFSICQLHTAAILNKHVQLLHPRSKNYIRAGTKCQVTGWGATVSDVFNISDTLQEVTVTIISRKLCNSQNYYNHNPIITKDMICAGDHRGKKDSCQVRVSPSDRHLPSTAVKTLCPLALRRGLRNTKPRF